jgi:tight adherence protein C
MLPIPSIILLLAFAVAAFLALVSLVPSGARKQAEEVLGLEGVRAARASPLVEVLRPLLRFLTPLVRPIEFRKYRENTERKFVSAGMTGVMSSNEFLAYKFVMSVVLWILFVGILCKLVTGWSEPFVVDLAAIILGFIFPDAWINGMVRRRQDEIRRSLPYVMDLLTLSVEAGLDFVAGLYKVCEKARSGPLIDELSFFLREIQVGASRQQALRNLAWRCNMPEISSFSALLIQADILGASVGPVLRAQSDLIRTQRFQRAERAGAMASQKILFPLIFCIMPAVFIVIFGPILLNFIYGTGVIGGGSAATGM